MPEMTAFVRSTDTDLGIAAVLAPIVERWRTMAGWIVGSALAAAVIILVLPRSYEAGVTVATISSGESLNLGSAASLLPGALGSLGGTSGVEASPALVSSLMRSRRVLTAVGMTEAPGGGRIVDKLKGRSVGETDIAKEVNKKVKVQVNKETGLVALTVTARDSALARKLATSIIEETASAYAATTRAQATQLRIAQEARVDSASRRLERVEEQLTAFQSANRTFARYSRQALQQQALERAQSVAQQVYMKAVADRESAVAKELEITPAIVVVDPVPRTLAYASRFLVIITMLAAIAGFLISVGLILIGEMLRRERLGRDADAERLFRALDTVPVVGRMRRRAALPR